MSFIAELITNDLEKIKSSQTEQDKRFFEDKGIDVNSQDALNKALFDSVIEGDAELPLRLIKLGADVNAYKENGMTVLAAAMTKGSETLIPILTYLSNPQTRRETVEKNRDVVEKFESKLDYVAESIKQMGQEDYWTKMQQEIEELRIKKIKAEEEKKKKEEEEKSAQDKKIKDEELAKNEPEILSEIFKEALEKDKNKDEKPQNESDDLGNSFVEFVATTGNIGKKAAGVVGQILSEGPSNIKDKLAKILANRDANKSESKDDRGSR